MVKRSFTIGLFAVLVLGNEFVHAQNLFQPRQQSRGWGGNQYQSEGNSNSSSDGGYNWGNALDDLFQGLDRGIRESQRQPQYYPQQRPQQQYYPQPRQQFNPPPRPRPRRRARVRKNKKAPEKIREAKKNFDPGNNGLDPIDNESLKLTNQVVEEATQEEAKEIKEQLSNLEDAAGNPVDATTDPVVKAALDNIDEKIAAGERVTEADVTAVNTALMAGGFRLPAGVNQADVDANFDQLIGLSEVNEHLAGQIPGGTVPTFPGGMTQIVTFPALGGDDMMVLPDGTVLVGTDGEGDYGITDASGSELMGMELGVGEPVPDSSADVANRVKSGTLLLNPNENDSSVSYVVANKNYDLEPGYRQRLGSGRTIRFDRGEGNGKATYKLSEGTYAFGSSDRGWELYKKKFSVTIDNSSNDTPFLYNIDNSQEEVAGGQAESHSSAYPMLIHFDRGGDGDETSKKVKGKSDEFVVAVNPQDGLWDLYPADNYTEVARRGGGGETDKSSRTARLKRREGDPDDARNGLDA